MAGIQTYEVDIDGVTYEVDAPDENTAWKWAKTTHNKPKLSLVDQIPGGEGVQLTPDPEDTASDWEKIKAAGQAVGGTVQNMAMSIPANFIGAAKDVLGGTAGQGSTVGPRTASNVMNTLGRRPQSQLESDYTNKIGESLNDAGVMAIPGVTGIPGLRNVRAGYKQQFSPIAKSSFGQYVKPGVENAKTMFSKSVTMAPKFAAAVLSDKSPVLLEKIYSDARAGKTKTAQSMRGNIPETKILSDALEGVKRAQELNQQEYLNARSGWAADKTPLNFASIDEAFSKLKSSLEEGGHSKIGGTELNKIKEVEAVLDEWRSDPSVHTTVGLDALKQRLDAIYPDSPMQNQAQRVISGTSKAVRDTIIKQAPDYAKAMEAYASRLETIRDINAALLTSGRSTKDMAIRRLKTLAMKDQHFRRAIAEKLKQEGGIDIMGEIAGQEMQNWMPERFGRMTALGVGSLSWAASNPVAAAMVLPFTSPRVVGELAHGAGTAMRKVFGPTKQNTTPWVSSRPTIPASQNLVPFTDVLPPEAGGIPAVSRRPNWISPLYPDIQPVQPSSSNLLGNTPNAEMIRPRQWENRSQVMDQAAQQAESSVPRQPTSGGQLYDLDPITGRLKAVDQGLRGATPDVIRSTGNDLASAAQKVSSGKLFDMTTEERIAWNKTKIELERAIPEIRGISGKELAERTMDRKWVMEQIAKSREKAAGYEAIAKRSEDASRIRSANIERQKLMDTAEMLDEILNNQSGVRYKSGNNATGLLNF